MNVFTYHIFLKNDLKMLGTLFPFEPWKTYWNSQFVYTRTHFNFFLLFLATRLFTNRMQHRNAFVSFSKCCKRGIQCVCFSFVWAILCGMHVALQSIQDASSDFFFQLNRLADMWGYKWILALKFNWIQLSVNEYIAH